MNAQTVVWFGISGGALIFALSLLHARYIAKQPRAMQSRGSYTLFAVFMLIFSLGALAAAIVSRD